MKLNKQAERKAEELIDAHHYVKESDWSQDQPSTEDENAFLGRKGWKAYGNWHLGIHEEESKETKGRYGFPFGDFSRLHSSGLRAIKQRAAQQRYREVEKAADRLLKRLDRTAAD